MITIAELEKELVEAKQAPRVGERVAVHYEISEGEKTRTQRFEGLVIAVKNSGNRLTFTVRKESLGVGVERVFPLYSPFVAQVDILKKHKVRRSKLYFQRSLRGKAARLKEVRRRK